MVRDAPEGGGARYRFDVEPADIRGYAGQLYRASEHGEKAIAGSFRRFVEWRSQQSPEALAEAAEIGRKALDEAA
jgi:hypothetical protein